MQLRVSDEIRQNLMNNQIPMGKVCFYRVSSDFPRNRYLKPHNGVHASQLHSYCGHFELSSANFHEVQKNIKIYLFEVMHPCSACYLSEHV